MKISVFKRHVRFIPVLVFGLILAAFQTADAQNRTMHWSTEFCDYSGVYNSRKYTEAKLRNTLKLLSHGELRLNTSATVWDYSDIDKLDVQKLDAEYESVRKELDELDIVSGEFWESIRRSKLKEIKQVYELSRATMVAYKKPEVLNDLDWDPSCKKRFVPALIAGGDDLLKVWTDVNIEGRAKNVDPARIKRVFEERYDSPQRSQYALVETMSFGWWNCANTFIEYDSQNGPDYMERETAFKKLFVSVKELECEEP